jgi:LysM repeat protein
MQKKSKILLMIAGLTLSAIMCTKSALTTTPEIVGEPLTAILNEVEGQVFLLKSDGENFETISDGIEIEVGDQVLTMEDSQVKIDLSSGTKIRLGTLSSFILMEAMNTKEIGPFAKIKLDTGKLWIILNGGQVDVDTPSGLASVRGSYLHVWVNSQTGETMISCLEGVCDLSNNMGKVELIAGQNAMVSGISSIPAQGLMSNEDVEEWLEMNPEATMVMDEVRATVASYSDPATESPIETATNTSSPLPSGTKTPAETLTPTISLIPSETPITCGPNDTWISYTILSGETLSSLSAKYRVSIADIQFNNCLGNSTSLIVGQKIFVPDVTTNTPISPSTTKNNNDVNANFTNPIGPTGAITNCSNIFGIDVVEPDGIQNVAVFYGINDYSAPNYFLLSAASGNSWSSINTISTYVLGGTDTVYYKFVVVDNLYNFQSGGTIYTYTDNLDCGGISPSTTNTITIAPTITQTPLACGSYESWIPYTIKSGDNLYRISLSYNVTIKELQTANCMGESTLIIAGKLLLVP